MDTKILATSKELLKRLAKINGFSAKYKIYPTEEANKLIKDIYDFTDSIESVENPETNDDLIKSELKRRLRGEAFAAELTLGKSNADFDAIVSLYSIPLEDISALRGWLDANQKETLSAIGRLYAKRDTLNYELNMTDIPSVKRQAEEFAQVHIQRYHKAIGRMLENLTNVGQFLRDVEAAPTVKDRAYFNYIVRTLAISIGDICYTSEDGNLNIRENKLVELYGHEGMGHALNNIITKSSNLPYFLQDEHSRIVEATCESVAQFYERRIFEDILNSPETQNKLGLEHKFDQIYAEEKDKELLNEYKNKLFFYAITVLADKNLGNPQDPEVLKKKINTLKEVTLNPLWPADFIEENKYKYDCDGNFSAGLVSELRYCADPVKRAIKEFENQGIYYSSKDRSLIDSVILNGFWTPIGFVDNARIKAKEYKQSQKSA